jgi:signal transduction histidine kinase/ActR/RegA family two-component response regulator
MQRRAVRRSPSHESREIIQALYTLVDHVSRASSVATIYEEALIALMATVMPDRASVLVFDEADVMRFRAWHALSADYRAAVEGHSPWNRDAVDPAPIVVRDVFADPSLASYEAVFRAEGIRALAFIPLVGDGQLLGKFMLYYDTLHDLSTDELQLAQTIAHHVAFGLRRQAREQEAAQAARRREELRAEAERANRAKDEFIAMVSHELRTPMTAMLGWTRMLRSGQLDAKSAAHALDVIERNLRQQTQILTDLLDVSRIVSGKLTLDLQQVDLASVIEMAVEIVRPVVDAKELKLTTSLATGLGRVLGDETRLQQVFWNLISNAVKFTPAGGRIDVRLERIDDRARVSVVDTGRGIAPEFLPQLFERFRQAETGFTRHHGGLGLGLAIVRNLVDLHGGRVYASSAGEGHGATFVVELPLTTSHAAPSPPLDRPELRNGRPKLSNIRVLIVDDHRDTVDFLAAALAQYGADVDVATSVHAALESLAQQRPHVVVSDLSMPGEDGFSLMQRIRARDADARRLTAIALTAHARAQDREKALAAGFQMYLAKPIEPARLGYVIEALLRGEAQTQG